MWSLRMFSYRSFYQNCGLCIGDADTLLLHSLFLSYFIISISHQNLCSCVLPGNKHDGIERTVQNGLDLWSITFLVIWISGVVRSSEISHNGQQWTLSAAVHWPIYRSVAARQWRCAIHSRYICCCPGNDVWFFGMALPVDCCMSPKPTESFLIITRQLRKVLWHNGCPSHNLLQCLTLTTNVAKECKNEKHKNNLTQSSQRTKKTRYDGCQTYTRGTAPWDAPLQKKLSFPKGALEPI